MSLPPPSRSSTFQHQRVQVWIWGIKRSHNGNSVMSLCAPSFIPPTCCYIPALILKGKKRRGAVKRLVSRHKMFQISLSSTSDSEQTWSSLPTSVQTGPNWTLSPRPPPLSPLPLPPWGGQRDRVWRPHAGAGRGTARGLRRETRHLLRVLVSRSLRFMFPNRIAAPSVGTFHHRQNVRPLKRQHPGVVQTEGG